MGKTGFLGEDLCTAGMSWSSASVAMGGIPAKIHSKAFIFNKINDLCIRPRFGHRKKKPCHPGT
jgi:hypothetical protein